MTSRQRILSNRLKHFILDMLKKMLLYTIGVALVLIIFISIILPLIIYLLIGDYSINKRLARNTDYP